MNRENSEQLTDEERELVQRFHEEQRPRHRHPTRFVGVLTGPVSWFKDEKGYGRITGDDGYVNLVHFSSIRMEGYRSLREGQRVEFEWLGAVADHDRKVAEMFAPVEGSRRPSTLAYF